MADKLPVTVTPAIVTCQMCRRPEQRGAVFTVGKDTQPRSLCVYCLVAIAVDASSAVTRLAREQVHKSRTIHLPR